MPLTSRAGALGLKQPLRTRKADLLLLLLLALLLLS